MNMLKSGLGFLVALCLISSASAATVYKSFGKAEDALKKGQKQFGVIVTQLNKIELPSIKGEHDFAYRVKVEVLARDPKAGGSFSRVRSFETVAFLDDVVYTLSAWRKGGVSMTIYLDEFDQTVVRLKGVRGEIQMNTHSNQR